MADNTVLDLGSGGDTVATDDIGGIKFPRSKITIGADGTNDGDVSSANPLPITGTVTAVTDITNTVTVDGTGTFVVQVDGDALTALQLIDDAIYIDDADWVDGTSKHLLIGGLYQSSPQAITDGDVGPIQVTANGYPIVSVNGTVTVGSHAVTNAGTFAVQATLDAETTKVIGTVNIAAAQTVAVTNTGTFATQATLAAETTKVIGTVNIAAAQTVAAVTDITNTVTVDGTGTFVTQIDGDALTALQLIDDAVYADNDAFTLTSSKVFATGAIRDDSLSTLAAVEGDVVPLRVGSTGALHVTGAGGGTQYQIDDAGGATDTGTLALAIRDDSLTTLTPDDGDYVGLRVSSTGALHVTGGGGGTEYTEDETTPATIVGTATVMERDDEIAPLTPVAGDWAAMRCSAEGALWVQDFNSDAILADTAAMDTNLATIAGAVSTEMQVDVVAALPAGDNNIGNVDIASGTVTTVSTVTNLSNLGGAAINMNAGVLGAGTQRVTIATDDEVNNLLGTIDTDTGNIATNTTGLAGCVGGTELQVDVVAALPAGTNAIGKLAANNGVDIGDVDVTSIAAGTNTIGGTIAQQSSNTLYEGTTAKTVQHFHTVTSTSDTSIITAGGAGVKFRILSLSIIGLSATVTNVHFETKTTNTDCFGDSTNPIPIAVDADGDNVAGVILPWNPGGWFETADANEDLAVILSAAQPVMICGNYIEVA